MKGRDEVAGARSADRRGPRSKVATGPGSAVRALVAAALLSPLGCRAESPAAPDNAIPVTMVQVEKRRRLLDVRSSGLLAARREVQLAFEVQGHVASINADEGDPIPAGFVIASLDPTEVKARFQRARAEYRKAQRDVERIVELTSRGASSRVSEEDAHIAFDAAEANLKIARYELEHVDLVAPFAGRLARRFVESNELVRRGDVAATLVDYEPVILARVGVNARDIALLAIGDPAEIRAEAVRDEAFPGRVWSRGVSAHADTGTFNVEIEVQNAGGRLLPGMVVEARISPVAGTAQEGEHNGSVPMIPVAALVDAAGSRGYVFAAEGGRARRVRVLLGEIAGDEVEVRAGLEPGSTIILEGAKLLRDGSRVIVSENAIGLPPPD